MNKRLVRLKCGATGVDLGHGYGLFVSAQDNDIAMDEISTDPYGDPPQKGLPIPPKDSISAGRLAVSYFAFHGKIE